MISFYGVRTGSGPDGTTGWVKLPFRISAGLFAIAAGNGIGSDPLSVTILRFRHWLRAANPQMGSFEAVRAHQKLVVP